MLLEEFETVRMIDGQPFIVAKYIPLDIRKQLRSSNKAVSQASSD
jgi:hypothetical protein